MKKATLEFTKDEIKVMTMAIGETLRTFPRWGDGKYLRALRSCSRRLVLANTLMMRTRGRTKIDKAKEDDQDE